MSKTARIHEDTGFLVDYFALLDLSICTIYLYYIIIFVGFCFVLL